MVIKMGSSPSWQNLEEICSMDVDKNSEETAKLRSP
jgi:hypothetical protein